MDKHIYVNQESKLTESQLKNTSLYKGIEELEFVKMQISLVDRAEKLAVQMSLVCARIDSIILNNPLVKDCFTLSKKNLDGKPELVTYLVAEKTLLLKQLQDRLQEFIPSQFLPTAYVLVSNLPLTSTGEVDREKLSNLPVIDADLAKKYEIELQSYPEIDRVAVMIEELNDSLPSLHLSDLLPDWSRKIKRRQRADGRGQKITHKYRDLYPNQTIQLIDDENLDPSDSSNLAISHGEPLELESNHPVILSTILERTAQTNPDQGIIYLDTNEKDSFQSYRELLATANRIRSGLRQLGIKPKDKVILQLEQNQDFIEVFWGCILGGFVPVPISVASTYTPTNNSAKKLVNAWDSLQQPIVVTSAKLAAEIDNLATQLNLKNFRVETIDNLRSSQADNYQYQAKPEDLALLLLTSGSTGIPKGVMLTHQNIISNIAASAQFSQLTKDDISLNWLRLDHIGSLVRCSIRDVYVGSQQVHAPTELFLENPLRLLDWIAKYRVTFAWLPNFALSLINDRADLIKQGNWDLSSLKSMLSVAEAIVPKTAKKFTELLTPHGLSAEKMHSAWGMSETCAAVVTSHRYLLELSDDDYPYVEVGAPIPGLSLRIVDNQNRIVAEETIGHLQIKGAMIVNSYDNNPQLNREAFTEDGWLKTGDLGYFRQGRLTVTGREKDIIIINGLNHYAHEIEAVAEEVKGVEVSYTAACGLRVLGEDTDRLLIFFHTAITEDDRLLELIKEIQNKIVRQIGISPTYLIPVSKEAIPKTSIGKIQRKQLLERFQAGEFEKTLKRVDLLLNNENTLPDWFYRQVWRPKQAIHLQHQLSSGLTLIFSDNWGLGEYLSQKLNNNINRYDHQSRDNAIIQPENDRDCIIIEARSKFLQLENDRYCIDPTNPKHYQQLLETVTQDNRSIDQIVHLWTYDREVQEITNLEDLEQAQHRGIYSLLFLVQALTKIRQNSGDRVRLQVISNNTQPISSQENIAYQNSPLLGLIKTFSKELIWLDCRHLDLCLNSLETNAAYILKELQVVQEDREVAYRDRQRLIPTLQKINSPRSAKLPLKTGGMYLITGGLGGIGLEIAKYLLKQHQARLLLLGKTSLPDRDTWEHHLQKNDRVTEKILAYLSLEKLGGEIAYQNIDLCDLTQLQRVVKTFESKWQCQLEGIIHLAGIAPERLLIEETRDSLAQTLNSKVFATWVLHQLLKNRPKSIFITLSSVIGFFGGSTVGAYSAANNFLDSFTYYQRQQSLKSYCFGSSTWNQIGVNRGYQGSDLRRAQGQMTMSIEQGINSLMVGLQQDLPYLIFGLDGTKRAIQKYTLEEVYPTQTLQAYLTTKNDRILLRQKPQIEDRFGNLTNCQFKQLDRMPLTETGEIDRKQLARIDRSKNQAITPRNEVERQLARIWQELLGVDSVSIQDNFFELGGTSLLALSLFAQINQTFDRDLPLSTLFTASTIEELGKILVDREDYSTSWSSLVPIQSKGSKPPLFLIHARGSSILIYRDLAANLRKDRPVYGIQPQGLNSQQKPLTRVEDMAAYYIKQIQTIQPQGPYFLGGYSFGGKLAFEMAQQLNKQGQKVSLLAMIDCRGLNCYQRLPLKQRIIIHLKNLIAKKHGYIFQKIEDWNRWLSYEFQYELQKITLQVFQMLNLPLSLKLRNVLVEKVNLQASIDYQPQYYPGKITLFKAVEWLGGVGCEIDEQLGWGTLAGEGVEVRYVSGDHLSVLNQIHVQSLAKELQLCLDRAEDPAQIL